MIDLDVKGGLDGPGEFGRFADRHGFAWSPTAVTRSGGLHVYFRSEVPLKTKAGVLPGVDSRGHHGYVCLYSVPPPLDELQVVPDAVVELVGVAGQYRAPNLPPPPPRVAGECSRWGRVRLERNLADLAAARGGCRNLTLNRAAYKIAQAVAAGHIPHGLAWAELARVAASIGLGPVEVERTLHSAFRAAQRDPRGPE